MGESFNSDRGQRRLRGVAMKWCEPGEGSGCLRGVSCEIIS